MLLCYNAHLSELNVSGCTSLDFLNCKDNSDLKVIDIIDSPNLSTFRHDDGLLVIDSTMAVAITDNSLEPGEVKASYSKTFTANYADVTWSSSELPAGLYLSSTTGELSGTPRKADTYTFTVTASLGRLSATREYTLTVVPDEHNSLYIREYFPDSWFDNYVSSNFDKDSDGYLNDEEIAAVETMNIYYRRIESLQGIRYFTALKELDCRGNELTELDLSNNPLLETLNCSYNQLTILDVSNNSVLASLNCSKNQLAELKTGKSMLLTELDCSGNKLAELNVSGYENLQDLNCSSNQLAGLNVSRNIHLQHLECYENSLAALDLSRSTSLWEVICFDNQLTELNLGSLPEIGLLHCDNNNLTVIDISGCPYLHDDEENEYYAEFGYDNGVQIISNPIPEFNAGHALVLDGTIGVIFYVAFPEEPGSTYTSENCWMTFDIRGDTSNNPQPLDTQSSLNFTAPPESSTTPSSVTSTPHKWLTPSPQLSTTETDSPSLRTAAQTII